jgi:membrane-associated protease RseP (regulator of RpoE activity)
LLTSLSWFLTVIFSYRYSISAYALNLKVFQPVLYEGDLSILARAIPMTLGVLPILQSIHELAHRITATYYNVTLGAPRWILPLRPIGSYSAITPLTSFPASRVHLMDIASSGPISALLLSIVCLVLGITFSCKTTSNSVLASMPVVSVEFFRSSFLLGSITSFLSPRLMLLPLAQPVPVHPLVMVGYSGLFSSALNLLPIGKLDGGRMFMAAFGRGTAKLVTTLIMGLIWPAAFLVLPNGFLPNHFSLWNFIAILTQSSLDVQLRDDVTEIDTFRRKCYIGLLVLVFTILIPFPRTLR